jgi:hypothetical protein
MKMSETKEKTDQLISNMARRTQTITTEMQITSESLRRASETLESLLNRLHADPSEIIFSDPLPRK